MDILPADLWLHILDSASPRDVMRFGKTCKTARCMALQTSLWTRLRIGMKLPAPKPRAWKLKTSYHIVVASACYKCMSRKRLAQQRICSDCIRNTAILQKQWEVLASLRRDRRYVRGDLWNLSRQLQIMEIQPVDSHNIEVIHFLTNMRERQTLRYKHLEDQYIYHDKLWKTFVEHVLRKRE